MSSGLLHCIRFMQFAGVSLVLGCLIGCSALSYASEITVSKSTSVTTTQGALSKKVTTTTTMTKELSSIEGASKSTSNVDPTSSSVSAPSSVSTLTPGADKSGANQVGAKQYANLTLSLFLNAMSEKLEYNEAFDYVKRGKIAHLNMGRNAYRVARNMVDKVIVYKSHYRMELLKDGKVIRKYWIALSDRPRGDKQYEGDRRTPEGTYTLDYVKERSYYYRAFHISYPNSQDIAEARRLGLRPGGMIMVHGQPPSSGEYEESIQRTNWTNGCIALLNHEIDEFIELVDPGTPIEILP